MKKSSESNKEHSMRPAILPDARENQLTSLAIDLVEQQIRDGTASPSVLVHYLKVASSKERLEKEILTEQAKLIKAKTEAIESQKRIEEIYKEALKAMKTYQGLGGQTSEELPRDD